MATPAQFARNMRSLADRIDRNATRLVRTTAGAVLQAVVLATPVGNPSLWASGSAPPGYTGGRARANWQVGLGGPVGGTLATIDPQGSKTIAGGAARMQASQRGQPIHLTNNLPYITPLNEGHSSQAPAGFVQAAVAAGAAHARAQRIVD